MLLRNDLPEIDRFFSSVREKSNFSQPLLNVFFNQSDACLVTDGVFDVSVELNPQLGRQLKVLESSSKLVCEVTFYRKSLDENTKQSISQEVLNLKNTVHGQQILMLFNCEDFVELKESDLEAVKSLLDQYEALKMKNENVKLYSGSSN